MILALIWLVAMTLFMLHYFWLTWIRPVIIWRANWPFEPGPDVAVSWRERWNRSNWRYDTWTDRGYALSGLMMIVTLWLAASGVLNWL